MSAWDQGWALGAQKAMQQRQFAEANRVAGRDAQASQYMSAIQAPENDPHDPALRPDPNDAPDVAQKKLDTIKERTANQQDLFTKHNALFDPHEAPTLLARLGGLMTGKQKGGKSSTASSTPAATSAPASSGPSVAPGTESNGPQPPVGATTPPADALGIPISDPNVAAAHAQPMHPMSTGHAMIGRFQEAIDALGKHLNAAAHPIAPPDTSGNAALLAQTYVSPETIKREDVQTAAQNAQDLMNTRGGFGVTEAEIRAAATRGTFNNTGAQTLDTAKALAGKGAIYTDFHTGMPIDIDTLMEIVPDAKLVPYLQAGQMKGWMVADQKGHAITVDNQKKSMGEFGTFLHEPSLGAATVGHTTGKWGVDGNNNPVWIGESTTSPNPPQNPVSSPPPPTPQPPAPVPGQTPTLQRRVAGTSTGGTPVSPAASSLSDTNAGITAANAASTRLNKGKPQPQSQPNRPVSLKAPALLGGDIPADIQTKGILPSINTMTPQNANRAVKTQPAVTAVLGMFGDPQHPEVKSMADFADLANDPHAQKTLGAAFQLLDKHLGEVNDPGILSTLASAAGWQNVRAGVEAGVQQAAGSAMTSREKEYFDQAIASMADIIGSRSATGQSAAKFSVNSIQNELPMIGTSSVTDKNSYITKLQTVARQMKIGLNAMPDNSRAMRWLDLKTRQLNGAKQSGTPQAAPMKGTISLAQARNLPAYKGKSDAQITADAKAYGYEVKP